MDRFAEWLWQRYRRNYLHAMVGVCLILLLPIFVPAFGVVQVVYGDVQATSIFAATALSLIVLMAAVTGSQFRNAYRPIGALGMGEDFDPTEAWIAATRLSELFAVRAVVTICVPVTLGSAVIAYLVLDESFAAALAVAGGAALVSMMATTVVGAAGSALTGPVVREVFHLVPDSARSPVRSSTLSRRLAIVVWCSTATGAVFGGIVAQYGDTPGQVHLIAIGMALASATYATVMFEALAVQPMLKPLKELAGGVARVTAGDYTVRVPVVSADDLGELSIAFNGMLRGLRERESLQAAFGSYVDPALAERLLAQGDSTFDGEEVDVTVFFADVRGFTSYSAKATAQEAVTRLNQLFSLIVPIIRDAGGHANGYRGDGVLAVFGTPNPLDGHADAAVAAAIEIQQAVRAEFGDELRIGIGINTGQVIAGTIGGGGKLEFTVIGDAVNVASRVESLTKETGDGILLTRATCQAMSFAPPELNDRGEFEIRGKPEPLHLFALCGAERT